MLVLDTKKLQIKYKTLKKKWREMIDSLRKGSRLALKSYRHDVTL